MLSWLKNNVIQIVIIVITVTFGYANFTAKIETTAKAQDELKSDVKEYQKETNEKLDKAVKLLERIDERTKKL